MKKYLILSVIASLLFALISCENSNNLETSQVSTIEKEYELPREPKREHNYR